MEKQNKKIRKKLISGVVTVILIMAICLCLFSFAQVVNKGYVSFFGYSFFKVTTGSMEPTISVGALILTQDVQIDTIELDDLVSFSSKEAYMNGRIITHRVVSKEISAKGQVLLTTRGDANSSTDIHGVDEGNLIGKVVWISGEGNVFAKLINFLFGRAGFFTCIALPAILISVFIFKRSMTIILTDIKRLKDEFEQQDHKKDNEDSVEESVSSNKGAKMALTPEEYEEMRARIRTELTEELNAGYDREQSKKQ